MTRMEEQVPCYLALAALRSRPFDPGRTLFLAALSSAVTIAVIFGASSLYRTALRIKFGSFASASAEL